MSQITAFPAFPESKVAAEASRRTNWNQAQTLSGAGRQEQAIPIKYASKNDKLILHNHVSYYRFVRIISGFKNGAVFDLFSIYTLLLSLILYAAVKPKPPLPLTEYRKLSDEDVIHRYVHRHEAQAMNCLYERYAHLVLGVCFKYLKETEAVKDATQQIFIKLLEDLKRFEIVHFKAWLMQVVRNYCLMQLRQSLPVVNNTIALPDDMEFEDDRHPLMDREALLNTLEAAVDNLNEAQKSCITLFYLEKLTYAVIALRTGYSVPDVKSHIQNGRRNLKIKLTHLKTAAAGQP